MASMSMSVYASNQATLTQDDVNANAEREVEISYDKGSEFTVRVPVLSSISSSLDWDEFKYGYYYWTSYADVSGDIASDEQIRIEFTEDIKMMPDGGMKDDILWLTSPRNVSLYNDTFTAERLSNPYIGKTAYATIIPNKDTTAGLWRGTIKVNIFVEPKEYVLTEEQLKQYIEDDITVETLTIPETIVIDNKTYRVAGLGSGALKDFANLKDVYLPEGISRFKLERAFADKTTATYNNDITVHGDCELYLAGYADMDVSVKVDGCTLYLAQNPYNGYNGAPAVNGNYYHYSEVGQYDFSSIVGGDYILGSWDEVTLNPNIKGFISYPFQHCFINKLIVPELKYASGEWWGIFRGCEIKELEWGSTFLADGWFSECTSLEKVTLTDGVESIGKEAFAGCTSLTEVIIPESVKNIDATAFSNTPFLENLKKGVEKVYINDIFICYGDLYEQGEYFEFPANLDIVSNDTVLNTVKHLSFEETDKPFKLASTARFPNITTLDLTGRILYNNTSVKHFTNVEKLIVGGETYYLPDYIDKSTLKEIVFEEGFTTIEDYGLNHATGYTGSSFYIPASVYKLGGYSTTKEYPYVSNVYGGKYGSGWSNHLFYDFGKDGVFKEFDVDEESEYYTDVDGILYTKDLQALVAVPRAYEFENGVFELPNEVRRLGELTFSRNPYIHELVISDNLEIFNNTNELEEYYSDRYCDTVMTLNEGNSLTLALYEFTDVKKYTAKDTNPNYTSIDGILYTKDLKELVAIPHGYEGAIIIPEGCEVWRENALWLNYDSGRGVNEGITSIHIPSTMKSIDEKQRAALVNKIGMSKITISDDNMYFTKFWNRLTKNDIIGNYSDWDGVKNTIWYSTSGSNKYTVGGDNSTQYARLNRIAIPEGTYNIWFDTDMEVAYKVIWHNANNMVTSLSADEISLNYGYGKRTFSVSGNKIICMCAAVKENGALIDMTEENAAKLIDALRIEKVSDYGLVLKQGYSNSTVEEYKYTTNSTRIRLGRPIELDPEKSYAITLSNTDPSYWFGVQAVNADGTVLIDSGWQKSGNTYLLSNAQNFVMNFSYGSGRNTTVTSEHLKYIAENLLIVETDHVHSHTAQRTEPDCVYDGLITYTCDCGNYYTEPIDATGHSYVDGICSVCGGLENITSASESGVYNEYGVLSSTWDELVTDGKITINNKNEVTKVDTSLGKTLVVPATVTGLYSSAFVDNTSMTNIHLQEGLSYIGTRTFGSCTNLTSIDIPSTVNLWSSTFQYCTSLKVANIPEGTLKIGQFMFDNCHSLVSVTMHDNITEIGTGAFNNTKNLRGIDLPDNLITIRDRAFLGSGIESITIPATVTSIEANAFKDCTNLKTVYFEGTTLPTIAAGAFNKTSGEVITFYVKNEGMKEALTTNYYSENFGVVKLDHEHSYGEYIVTTEATCISEGVKTRVCSVCGNEDSASIEVIEHTPEIEENPTFEYKGVTYTYAYTNELENTEHPYSLSDYMYVLITRWNDTYGTIYFVSDKPSSYMYYDSTTNLVLYNGVYHASNAGLDIDGFTYPEVNFNDTVETMELANAFINYLKESEFAVPYKHTVDVEPTCTTTGAKSVHCTVCGSIIPETEVEIPMTEHDFVDGQCTECGGSET